MNSVSYYNEQLVSIQLLASPYLFGEKINELVALLRQFMLKDEGRGFIYATSFVSAGEDELDRFYDTLQQLLRKFMHPYACSSVMRLLLELIKIEKTPYNTQIEHSSVLPVEEDLYTSKSLLVVKAMATLMHVIRIVKGGEYMFAKLLDFEGNILANMSSSHVLLILPGLKTILKAVRCKEIICTGLRQTSVSLVQILEAQYYR